MITPELLNYIKTEIAKGKTREEIHEVLLSGGGWNEGDLSEAFRTVIPMPNVVSSNPVVRAQQEEKKPFSAPATYTPSPSLLRPTLISKSPSPSSSHSSFPLLKLIIILIIIGGLGFGFWYYRSSITNLWDSLINNGSNSAIPSSNITQITPNPVTQAISQIKDCGTSATPKLGVPSSYEGNSVLSCLSESAVSCENAKGILKDDFFPTIFEIEKMQSSCNFKLSYPADSVLTDITGKSLAGQYILCPIDIVKAIDNTKTPPKFTVPNKTDLSKYGSDIYLYGTLGLFVENNLDANKIQALGCSGAYIQSVIASYAAKKTQ